MLKEVNGEGTIVKEKHFFWTCMGYWENRLTILSDHIVYLLVSFSHEVALFSLRAISREWWCVGEAETTKVYHPRSSYTYKAR